MTDQTSRPPVHESLSVVEHETIYKNGEWWKAVVRYQYDDSADDDEVAIYLWHDDDEWTRKNKYVIKTRDAWLTDSETVDDLLGESASAPTTTDFPVSDYYELAGGETVFKTEDWWKAIVNVSQKGDWETNEMMIYVWQKSDDEWRRRQKYTIKSEAKWEEEAAVVKSVLDLDPKGDEGAIDGDDAYTSAAGADEPANSSETEALETLQEEIDKHLSAKLEGE